MNRRFVAPVLALALSACFAGNIYAAGPKDGTRTTVSTTSNTSAKGKVVSFHLRNDSGSALTLQVGDQQMTVEAGKTADIKVPEGTQIITVNATGRIAAGGVVTTVSKVLSGNTLAVS